MGISLERRSQWSTCEQEGKSYLFFSNTSGLFKWSVQQQKVFEELRLKLYSSIILYWKLPLKYYYSVYRLINYSKIRPDMHQ